MCWSDTTLMFDYGNIISNLFKQSSFPEDAFYIDNVFRNRRIIVYGAGESFHYFKEIVMRQYGYMPSLILDRKFVQETVFEEIPARSPLNYSPNAEELQDTIVVVCLGHQRFFEQVVLDLRNIGFENIIALMDIYEIHNPFLLPQELEEKGFNYYLDNRERIESVVELLADDLSREVYLKCLQTHMSRRPVAIPMSERREQYVPRDIRLNRGYSRFIYCGVSVGEMESVFGQVGPVDELVCFEPDPNQFREVANCLSVNHSRFAERVIALPLALHSQDDVLPFSHSDTSFGSRIRAAGLSWIQAVSLDHVLPGFRPTMISMDIEGAELEALQGGEGMVKASTPDLAICVYHSPSQLWEIPLYLHGLNLCYRFYMRNYTSLTGETVLYATV